MLCEPAAIYYLTSKKYFYLKYSENYSTEHTENSKNIDIRFMLV